MIAKEVAEGSLAADLSAAVHRRNTRRSEFGVTFGYGMLGGAIGKTATAPFDRIAKLKQTGVMAEKNYTSICLQMRHEGGLRAAWKGNLTNCIRASPMKGILFAVNQALRGKMTKHFGVKKIYDEFAAGMAAGLVSTGITFPLDSAQTRLAGTQSAKGIFSTLVKLYKQSRLFEGAGPTLFGTMGYYGLKFGIYRVTEDFWLERNGNSRLNTVEKAGCGAWAAFWGNLLMFWNNSPRQILKTQGEAGVPKVSSYFEAVRHARRHGGLMRGFGAGIGRTMGSTAIQFVVFESLREWST